MRETLLQLPLLRTVPTEVWRKSPNSDARPRAAKISRLLIHADVFRTVAGLIAYIQNPRAEKKVSYHVSFGHGGACYRHVDFNRRAWHALNNNADTIGLNLSNIQDGKTPFPLGQLDAACAYIAWVIMPQYPGITMNRIFMHSTVDPSRKRDPFPNEPTFHMPTFLKRIEAYRAAPKP